MKKRGLIFIVFIIVLTCMSAACSERSAPTEFSVAFFTDGGKNIPSIFTDEIISQPVPTKEGYVFEGWYETKDFSSKRVVFPYKPVKDITLYAKYIDINKGNEELVFALSETGESYVLTSYTGDAAAVVVPAMHDGLPVKEVSDGFLKDYYALKEFYFSSELSTLGETFYYCPNLEGFFRIDEGEGVYDAKEGVLYTDGGKTLLKYPVSLKKNSAYVTAFSVPEGTENLADNAFRNALRLKSVTLPSSLVSIGNNFSALSSLESISASGEVFSSQNGVLFTSEGETLLIYPAGKTDDSYAIPDETTTVADGAFESAQTENLVLGDSTENFTPPVKAEKLLSFEVKNNPFFSVKEGILYDKDGKVLIKYPSAKEGERFSVPEGTEKIDSYAFYGASRLKELTLPSTVKEVASYAFCGGETGTVEKITFASESSLETVDGSAFTACKNLKTVVLSSRTPPDTDVSLLAEGDFYIYVPVNAEPFYRSEWGKIASRIHTSDVVLTPYEISFVSNGGTEIDAYYTVFIPSEPVTIREGYVFGGWFAEADFSGEKLSFPKAFYQNSVLYAYWIKK